MICIERQTMLIIRPPKPPEPSLKTERQPFFSVSLSVSILCSAFHALLHATNSKLPPILRPHLRPLPPRLKAQSLQAQCSLPFGLCGGPQGTEAASGWRKSQLMSTWDLAAFFLLGGRSPTPSAIWWRPFSLVLVCSRDTLVSGWRALIQLG